MFQLPRAVRAFVTFSAPKLVRTPPQTGTGKGNGIGEVAGAGAGQQIYRNF